LKKIYETLRADKIKKKKMKIKIKKLVLLSEDFKIIFFYTSLKKDILNYFSCCDNFSVVKFVILYFVRLPLPVLII